MIMNKILELYAYEAGLLSDGVPDSWDAEALMRYSRLLINHCCEIIREKGNDTPANVTSQYIKEVFDVEATEPTQAANSDEKTKNSIDTILFALLGSKDLVSRWWCSPNKAFGGEIAAVMFKKDKQKVIDYILSQYSR